METSTATHATLPERTIVQMLHHHAQTIPNRIALRQKDFGIWQPLSWADYWRRACGIGRAMRALGLARGCHVAIVSENRTEWVLAQLGAGVVGAVTVGVYATSPASEIGYVLEHADVDMIVCEDQEQTEKVLAVLAQPGGLPRLRKIVVIDPKGLRSLPAEAREMILTFAELEAMGADRLDEYLPEMIQGVDAQRLDDIALMIYTSGSTGKPKGAMISYRNIRGVAPGLIERLGMDAHSTHLSYLPLCHVAEQMLTVFAPMYTGSQVNFGESIRTVQDDLREVAPTLFLGVPRIWEKLHGAVCIKMQEAGAPARWLYERATAACAPFAEKSPSQRSLRERLVYAWWYVLILRALQNFLGLRNTHVALTGAAPIPPEVLRFMRGLGVPLIEVYGLTESTGMILGQHPQRVRIGSVGEGAVGTELRRGDQGELLVRGDMVFAGYYKSPEATEKAIQDGWLHTGDVAEQGADGQWRIVDRLKDIIITAGGKNLTPSEIENAVKGSPYVKECIVIGEGRRFVSALIQIDFDNVGKWAQTQGIAFTHFRSLVEDSRVRALVQTEVDRANGQLAQVANVRRFHLLTKELDHDDGEVTATMKVRRSSIYQRYAEDIERLYA
ncbi:long-chain fatty acid--CoA ligase [Pigmentiphaga aceris]|uniref:Long-chain fatty acid--CoA ligase n=1 Tax=Pigmentiphaga aceris TaxID=1940612 RepID=A0A5C0AYY7_9BURK|nr:AMP-dependent synthetase/ligase [Pigmentiphaga aceris]QEI06896.1 long-chain fatty acid--CoA ligase [Pigmentiphaga aceris]